MNENKGQTIFLSVIGIATLLVAIVGATFAWFSTTVTSANQSSIVIQAISLGTVTWADGNTVEGSAVQPGWKDDKTATISTAAGNQATFPYDINLTYRNSFESNALTLKVTIPAGCAECSTTYSAATGLAKDAGSDVTVKVGTGEIAGASTSQEWKFDFEFGYHDSDQNANQGDLFQGLLVVDLGEATSVAP